MVVAVDVLCFLVLFNWRMWFGTKQRLVNAQVSFFWGEKKKASEISIYRQSSCPTTENQTLAFGEQLLPLLTRICEQVKRWRLYSSVRKRLTDDGTVFTVCITSCAVNLLPPRMMEGFAANIIYGMKMYFIRLFWKKLKMWLFSNVLFFF